MDFHPLFSSDRSAVQHALGTNGGNRCYIPKEYPGNDGVVLRHHPHLGLVRTISTENKVPPAGADRPLGNWWISAHLVRQQDINCLPCSGSMHFGVEPASRLADQDQWIGG